MKTFLPIVSAVLLGACLLWAPQTRAQQGSNVINTKHNLSSGGPGSIRVAGETETCKFCHTPHASNPIAPLWNREDPGTYYQTYESTTLVASVGQPTGSSRLCLSCHDGTIALTQTYNSRNAIAGTIFLSQQDSGHIGTDLTDDHPVSFVYDSSLAAQQGGMRDPASLPRELPLDHDKQLQCTTCHDPHSDTYGDFLRMDNHGSGLCVSCHDIQGWAVSAHASASASLAGASRDRWDNLSVGTVSAAGCESCHRPHSAGGRQRLLRHEAEEDNCFACHDGSVADKNVLAEMGKPSAHRVDLATGVHDPVERPRSMAEHVECADCHNAHRAASGGGAQAPFLKPAMAGATGLSTSAGQLTEATYEYEVCYKCHAWSNFAGSPAVHRIIHSVNLADKFSPANASYHPVEAQGKNTSVPSLLQSWDETSLIYCTDCHSSDGTGGAVAGPHGSNYRPLLVRNYDTDDNTNESPSAYALCYGCHSRTSILGDRSFDEHKKHIEGEDTPCSVCHDPHGISATQGSPAGSTHLINFDRDVVGPSDATGAGPFFEDRGFRRGSCTLRCHGEDHDDEDYAP